jgi:GNAT superfamily N-acetyltransferase
MPLVLEPSWTGRRVSVRRVVEREPSGRLRFGDVVGDLIALDDELAVVETRTGSVEVPVPLIAVAKLVPPSSADELAVEDAVAQGWRAAETGHVGGWLLRANDGFTGRANSVLPLRPPRMALDDALDAARRWYAQRQLPVKFQLPTESRRLLDAELAERGWPADPDVHVMTARIDLLLRAPAVDDAEVQLARTPDDAWFLRYRDGRGATQPARELLTRHDNVVFAAVPGASPGSPPTAIGRGTVDGEWLGVTAVEVDPASRRAGLARAIMRALWRWGADQGAARTHLQVNSDNVAALALYEDLGYATHHLYRYRTEPSGA